MPVAYADDAVVFTDEVGSDEAERLLEWLQTHAAARLDLSACTHLHPANVQVLLAAGAAVAAWPRDQSLASWLDPLLSAPAG